MPLYKMSDLAPMALAEINAIIRLASDKEKLAAQSAGRETTNAKSVRRARRSKQLELQLTKQN